MADDPGGATARGPLAGTIVVEAATFMSGPYAGMMLADLGADVIKVESAQGDPFRGFGRPETPYSAVFASCNRSKRSVVLDLKSGHGRDALLELLAGADVFLANWRAGVAESLGLADDVIAGLPKGYDQVIGKRFRNGVDLSGGEWQKVAIARAYMRDSQLLILDEPTAALDARSEFEVFQRFKELSDGRTAVLISHRFSSVRMADRILVLNRGQVEAVGTHEQLLAQQGRYAELFELQAAGYR